MRLEIQETATISVAADYKKASKPVQREWTAQNLGIELEADKVNHKRKLPIGEHIREAIDIIKQKGE
jgi:hypothetical protein